MEGDRERQREEMRMGREGWGLGQRARDFTQKTG